MTERRFALIIGNGAYDNADLPGLRTSIQNVIGLEHVLGDPAIGGFEVKTVEDQSFTEVRSAIVRFLANKQRDDLLLLYFSGHGLPADNSAGVFLAVKDTDPALPSDRGIEGSFITQQMDTRHCARVVIILDCCYSGGFMHAGSTLSADLPDFANIFNSGYGRAVLTASRASEKAWAEADPSQVVDTAEPHYSLFTHHLITGLETGAAGGSSEVITVDAWFDYVQQQVAKTPKSAPQTPRMKIDGREGGALQIARNPRYQRPVAPILNHHFLCYSAMDGLEQAEGLYQKLCQAGLSVWLDQRDARADLDFDTQVEEALRGCASLVLVLTPDSASSADTEREWRRALQYKKPVVLARFVPGVEPPLFLSNRPIFEFSGPIETATRRLCEHLTWRNSPEGQLATSKEQLADAHRDLRRAKPEERNRILNDIDLLKKQVAEQERIVRDPEGAARQTQANINSGLERERQPEKPVTGKTHTRFINPPPAMAPTYFQDRYVETQLIGEFLKDPAQRMMTVVGRAGIGKTALVCRLLKALENGYLPDNGGPLAVAGILYLSAVGTHQINLANLFADLCKLLPEVEAKELDALYRNPQASPAAKMQALLAHFPSLSGEEAARPVVVLLDNFEDLVDSETQELKDAELAEALVALLDALPHRVKVLITTRQACRSLLLHQPACQHKLELDNGLDSPFAENILRAMDSDGKVGLKTAPDALLAQAQERTRGYPRALEALYGILSADRYTSLAEVLEGAEHLLPENVVEALVGQAYSRLDPTAQLVLQALAVYERPVTPAAVDYLLQLYRPGLDSAKVLHRLVSMHFTRQEGGKYYLHPVDRAYAFARIPLEQAGDGFTQPVLLHRAADYFAQARLPRAAWKTIDDLSAQLSEIELRCAAGEYDTAGQVLAEIDFDYLLLWGHARRLIELHERLQGHLTDRDNRMSSLNTLGLAYNRTGQGQQAIDCYERGLALAREDHVRGWEGAYLGNLGGAYADFGQTVRAIAYYEQALTLLREIGDRRGEGSALGSLGNQYAELGQTAKAIEYYDQSLAIRREIGDRQGEGNILGNLGNRYAELGQTAKAIEYYDQVLTIFLEIGYRQGEGIDLINLGQVILDQGDTGKAITLLSQAQRIADGIDNPMVQNESRFFIAQIHLITGDLISSQEWIQAAGQYPYPQYDARVSALHGVISLRQGKRSEAQRAFQQAIAQAEHLLTENAQLYDLWDAKGLALCGLALVKGLDDADTISAAAEAYRKARSINRDPGIVQRVLRLFDQLAICDAEGRLAQVRDVIRLIRKSD